MRPVAGLVLLAGFSFTNVQLQPFSSISTPPFQEANPNEYQFDWPIQKVAIIGAGPRYLVCPGTVIGSSPTNTSL